MSADRLLHDDEQLVIDLARSILRDAGARLKARPDALVDKVVREGIVTSLTLELGNMSTEHAAVALFDSRGRLIVIERFPEGNPTSCEIPLRQLARFVLDHNASGALLAHNHPSGECSPSRQDERFTESAGKWLKTIDCALIDHLVVTVDDWCSIMGAWKC